MPGYVKLKKKINLNCVYLNVLNITLQEWITSSVINTLLFTKLQIEVSNSSFTNYLIIANYVT